MKIEKLRFLATDGSGSESEHALMLADLSGSGMEWNQN